MTVEMLLGATYKSDLSMNDPSVIPSAIAKKGQSLAPAWIKKLLDAGINHTEDVRVNLDTSLVNVQAQPSSAPAPDVWDFLAIAFSLRATVFTEASHQIGTVRTAIRDQASEKGPVDKVNAFLGDLVLGLGQGAFATLRRATGSLLTSFQDNRRSPRRRRSAYSAGAPSTTRPR